MKKKALLVFGLALILVLAMSVTAFAANDLKEFPDPVDPQSWEMPDDMTWDDWQDLPLIDWDEMDLPEAELQKGLIILVEYKDRGFTLSKPKGSDPMGNPLTDPVAKEDLAQFWADFLNVPSELNHKTTVNDYWRENSYGKWKVEIDAYGPYTLEGMEWEYGIDDFNGARTSVRNIGKEAIAAFVADPNPNKPKLSDYNFGFIVHAGYCESAVWQEMGEMMFQDEHSVPDNFGPTEEEIAAIKAYGAAGNDISWASGILNGENYVTSRYVPWTSWMAGKSVWSHATGYRAVEGDGTGLAPGTRFSFSVQGEDGMATFAHEFCHIKSVADNYNGPYNTPTERTYSGLWDVISRGCFNGPGGTHHRWEVPAIVGGSTPAHHTTRLKIKQDFFEEDQYNRISETSLIENGPVFETIVAREVPVSVNDAVAKELGFDGLGYGVNSLVIDMDKDNTPIMSKTDSNYVWNNVGTWGRMRGNYTEENGYGYYQFYSMEVVQRVSYDAYTTDSGVLINMNREVDNEAAPFIWVIDSHPEDINKVDFVRPNGENAMVSKGDARQLSDAAFHAGTGEDVVSEYFDKYNNLHFYILSKSYDDLGVLSYRVAVRSDEQVNASAYSDAFTLKVGDCSPAKAGNVAVQEIEITNKGTKTGLYRLSSENDQDWESMLSYEVIEVAAGETVTVPLYVQIPDFRPQDNDFSFTVVSEVSGQTATVEGTIKPGKGGIGVVGTTTSKVEEKPEAPVSELPFVDVAVNAWYYNDVLVAVKDGLVNGRTATTYVPEGNITIAEAIKLASTMHQKHTAGAVTLTNGTDAWYSTYVAYAVANGIIKDGEYTDMNAIATRAQFASIFAAALPAEALAAINAVEDGKIPDVKMADSYGAAVYKLYNAGILTGNDAIGTFAPMSNIKRSEVAAIVNRMMHVENRKNIAL